jgi:hypothetical protein
MDFCSFFFVPHTNPHFWTDRTTHDVTSASTLSHLLRLPPSFQRHISLAEWLHKLASPHSHVRVCVVNKRVYGPVHTSVISSGELAAASHLRLGIRRCIDLIHTRLRPRCDNVRSRGHRKAAKTTRFWLYRSISLDVWTQTDANSRTHVNECGTVTCVTAASSTEEMTDVWTGP